MPPLSDVIHSSHSKRVPVLCSLVWVLGSSRGRVDWRDRDSRLGRVWEILRDGRCDFDVLDISHVTAELLDTVYRSRKPLLIRFPNGAGDWSAPEAWQVGELARKYGDLEVGVGSSADIPVNNGHGPEKMKFRKFIGEYFPSNGTESTDDSQYHYMFDRHFFPQTQLPSTIKHPPVFSTIFPGTKSIVFIGDTWTSVAFHLHSLSWLGLISGRKKWYMYPPEVTPPGGMPQLSNMLDWLIFSYDDPTQTKNGHIWQCTQEAGEIVIVPELFHHAVVNLEPSIAIGYQNRHFQSTAGRFVQKWNGIFSRLHQDQSANRMSLSEERKQQLSEEYDQGAEEVFGRGGAPTWSRQSKLAVLCSSQLEKATEYETLVTRQPDLLSMRVALGEIYTEHGKVQEAEHHLDIALEQCPACHAVYTAYEHLLRARDPTGDELSQFRREYGPHLSVNSQVRRDIARALEAGMPYRTTPEL